MRTGRANQVSFPSLKIPESIYPPLLDDDVEYKTTGERIVPRGVLPTTTTMEESSSRSADGKPHMVQPVVTRSPEPKPVGDLPSKRTEQLASSLSNWNGFAEAV